MNTTRLRELLKDLEELVDDEAQDGGVFFIEEFLSDPSVGDRLGTIVYDTGYELDVVLRTVPASEQDDKPGADDGGPEAGAE